DNGTYMILNIPPGKYNVFCSRGGYGTAIRTGVQINLDLTTMQNFTLSKQAVEIEGYDVTEARTEMVQPTKTSSGRTITSEAMEDIAVESLEDVIAIQAGVTITDGELHIRGGRANEVVYTIDGMSVSDPVDGGSALTVDMDAVEITDVKTGGFTAEYGNAQSGIVNIITKSGKRDYSGKIEFISDHLIPGVDNSNSDEIKFNLGGPVFSPFISSLRDKFTFFINGTANWHDTRYKDYYISDPNEELKYLTSVFSTSNPYTDREDFVGFDLGNRNYNNYNMNMKFKYKFNAKQNLTFAVRGDQNKYKAFDYNWKYALDHFAKGESTQKQFAATYDHTFTPQMNMKIKASYYTKELIQGPDGIDRDEYFILNPDEFDSLATNEIGKCTGIIYLTNDGLIGPDKELLWVIMSDGKDKNMYDFANFVHPAYIYGFNADDENSVATFRTDFEYQLNEIHGFKTGVEITKHNIRKDRLTNPWVIDANRYMNYLYNYAIPTYWVYSINDSLLFSPIEIPEEEENFVRNLYSLDDYYAATLAAAGETDGYEANPWQAAYYLQDKMEWEGMIVNAGLRFDFWYLGGKYKILKDNNEYVWEDFDKDERMQMMISPRLGVSHPISETAVMHFAYNYQNQLPQMQYIFTTARPEDAITSASAIVVGKPNLEPQITVTYEVGLQKQLSENYVMTIQAYYKNIYNYVSTRKVVDDDNVTWFEYISEDYGSARGIDINLEKRLSNFIMGSASYSLSWANGNNSDTVIQDEAMSLREFPLDWDMRHNFSLNVTFRVAKGEEFYVPFTDFALPSLVTDDLSLNIFYNIASGTPYTPTTKDDTPFDTNSKLKPYTANANFRITKKFAFTEKSLFKVYMNIQNLFDKKNVNWVHRYTGSPYYDGKDISEPNSNPPYTAAEVQYIHDLYTKNPSNVTQGRTITFGVAFNF
ncbi:MAG: TonB-dependent receptor, partial [Candidatus Cloacimonetes bacterium]|nr:TonB-dependent receptor [Candidatus Cloacimonadota bacterium]